MNKHKYGSLYTIAQLFEYGAILLFLLSIGGGLFLGVLNGSLVLTVAAVIAGSFVSLIMYAIGEVIELLIALEANTRKTAAMLNSLGKRTGSK